MPTLAIIIVNYNVRFFLEQCLCSVEAAVKRFEEVYGPNSSEVYVVDNRSVDGSVAMVQERFPWVHCIANTENVGFSKANNQAMRGSQATYQLLLNPDTLIEENTLVAVTQFMDQHPDAGGLGVKMVDGTGAFLPESKRGLPTPWVAFYKVFGLSALFPKSKRFGGYHLGYLSADQTHEVDVLSGAFMLLRKSVLDRVGLLDETYFMYGEDIDLSYRIQLGGYKNYYFPGTRIIHYKGESTKKGSINYVFVFYKAMVIFARRHFGDKHAFWFSFLIHLAIWGRAGLSVFKRMVNRLALPLLDSALIFFLLQVIRWYWERNHIYVAGGKYPDEFTWGMLSTVALSLVLGMAAWGGYKKPFSAWPVWRGMGFAGLLILVMYGLLPEDWRYSRAVLVFGIAASTLGVVGVRNLFRILGLRSFQPPSPHPKRIIIIGNMAEADLVRALLQQAGRPVEIQQVLSPEVLHKGEDWALICKVLETEEVIFCLADLSPADIIEKMSQGQLQGVAYKIAYPGGRFIIGSDSIQSSGAWYAPEDFILSASAKRRQKRRTDLVMALAGFPIFFLLWPFMRKPGGFWQQWWAVCKGQKTWVGYGYSTDPRLPKIPEGVLGQGFLVAEGAELDPKIMGYLNQKYAKEYTPSMDIDILRRGWRWLGGAHRDFN
jgi:GT2 family glycosyltransferase